MAKQENGYRANIGSSSLILIFIILCLVTFGMLSLSAAKNDLNLAERNADAVTGYYEADRSSEAFYRMVSETVAAACKSSSEEEERKSQIKEALKDYYQEADGKIVTKVPMDRAQALWIELSVNTAGAGGVDICQWKVIMTEDYEIDDSMPVWTDAEGE